MKYIKNSIFCTKQFIKQFILYNLIYSVTHEIDIMKLLHHEVLYAMIIIKNILNSHILKIDKGIEHNSFIHMLYFVTYKSN